MKLSIIIPIYGVEKYIEKCLLSCIRQGAVKLGVDYEIICVNDGTPDDSASIARAIAGRYEGIRVVDQQNQGLSVARNTGTDIAVGDYIWYVDSDDFIEERCLERILPILSEGYDILALRHRDVFEDGSVREYDYSSLRGIDSGKEMLFQGCFSPCVQFFVFRRDLLKRNDLRFVPGIYHEDSEFTPRALAFADKLRLDSGCAYNYLRRTSGSITSSFKLKNAEDIFSVNRNLYEFSLRFDRETRRALNWQISTNLNTVFSGMGNLSADDRVRVVRLLKENRYLFRCMMNTRKAKFRIEGLLFLLNVRCALALYGACK